MSLGNILTASYWFQSPLSPTPRALWIMGVVWGLFIVFAVVASVRLRTARDGVARGVWRRFAAWAWTMGILGWLLFFSRFDRVLFFNRRYWWIVWLIPAVIWFLLVRRHARERAPALSAAARDAAYRERYLPKSKK
mgnify:CR=1 FL=1